MIDTELECIVIYKYKNSNCTLKILLKVIIQFKKNFRDFPSGPVVGTSPSNSGGACSIPDRGTRIPHASQSRNQNTEQKQYCNKCNKDFKYGPHQKKKTLKKF